MSSRAELREALEIALNDHDAYAERGRHRRAAGTLAGFISANRDALLAALANPDELREAKSFVETVTKGVPDGPCPTPDCTGGCALCRLHSIQQYFAALAPPDTGECETCGGAKWVGTKMSATWDEGEGPCPDCTGEAPEGAPERAESVGGPEAEDGSGLSDSERLRRLYRAAIGSAAYPSGTWSEDATEDYRALRRSFASEPSD